MRNDSRTDIKPSFRKIKLHVSTCIWLPENVACADQILPPIYIKRKRSAVARAATKEDAIVNVEGEHVARLRLLRLLSENLRNRNNQSKNAYDQRDFQTVTSHPMIVEMQFYNAIWEHRRT